MNQSKKLELSKETLRCLDDQDLTGVAGGGGWGGGGGAAAATTQQLQQHSDVCSSHCIQFRVPEPRALLTSALSRARDSMNRHQGQQMTLQPAPD